MREQQRLGYRLRINCRPFLSLCNPERERAVCSIRRNYWTASLQA
jgi:hypothetical protein